MARAALRWSAQKLADQSGVHYATVARLEAGDNIADESRDKLRAALQASGVLFIRAGELAPIAAVALTEPGKR